MLTTKCTFRAMLIAAMLAGYPHISEAETFKSAEFLKWPRESQESYFRTSIGMAGIIAAQNRKNQARCIDDWYFGKDARRNAELMKAMKRFPSFHPMGVILAILQKACGSFKYGG